MWWHFMDSIRLHTTSTLEPGHGKRDPQQLVCGGAWGRKSCLHSVPGLGLSVPVCRAGHNLHVIKAQGKQSLSRDLSCCRERVRGELGRGCNDENKSVCINSTGKMMMCLISKALPFKRRVSLG